MPLGYVVASGLAGGAGFFASGELVDAYQRANGQTPSADKPAITIGKPSAATKDMAGGGGIAISKTAAIVAGGIVLIIAYLGYKHG